MPILGFETITANITAEEVGLAEYVATGLIKKVGKVNAISNKTMRAWLITNKSIELSGARFRKLIGYIREAGLVKRLCSNSNGYYVAANKEELVEYIQSREQRVNEIERGTRALAKDLIVDFDTDYINYSIYSMG